MLALNDERPVEILLVEDNLPTCLYQEVFKEGKIRNRLSVAWNGEGGAGLFTPGRPLYGYAEAGYHPIQSTSRAKMDARCWQKLKRTLNSCKSRL